MSIDYSDMAFPKPKKKKKRKRKKRDEYFSVFTDDLHHCYFTGSSTCHLHHIFYGIRKDMSEHYGFMIPLSPDLHNMNPDSVHGNPNEGLDKKLKQMAQTYYEERIGTRDDFRADFEKSWL